MKKSLLLITTILLAFAFLLSACGGPVISTASIIVVNEKGHSTDDDEYWIKAYDPNNQTKAEAFKIIVVEEMTWELIEENKEYFSSYQKEGDRPWVLTQIEHADTSTIEK